jgi:transcriptional regulator GlxA family with amidase domain
VDDFAIALVRKHLGDRTARLTAKIALVGDGRASQSPYVDSLLLRRQNDQFTRDVCDYLDHQLSNDYCLATLADSMHVSDRTLLRRFRDQAGSTPLRYLQQQRINKAKQLLEQGITCDDAMRAVGYTDPAAFRRLFSREAGMPPGTYRRQFARA